MMVKQLVDRHGYPVEQACELVEMSRSTYYYRSQKADESQLTADLKEVAGQFVKYGTRRICQQLQRQPHRYRINRKRVQRIMRREGLLRSQKRKKKRTTNSDHPYPRYKNLVKELDITYPDQVWACDITYIRLERGFVYLAIVMDVFTRAIRGWHLSKSLGQELTLAALKMALADHVPEIHHSDQGIQYAAYEYIDSLKKYKVRISMSSIGKPQENGYAERLMRTIKEEEVDLSEYQDYADTMNQIGHFIEDVYMTKRIHSSLGYLTPAEYEADWLSSRLVADTP
jgi:transposase InsO family protein